VTFTRLFIRIRETQKFRFITGLRRLDGEPTRMPPSPDPSRNLLFALLAQQNGKIEQAQIPGTVTPAVCLRKISRGAVHVRATDFVRFHPVLPIIAEVAYATVKTEAGARAVLSIGQER
jgi:hypothetical protein